MEGSKFDDLAIIVAFRFILDILFALLFFGTLLFGIIIDKIDGKGKLFTLIILLAPVAFIATTYLIDLFTHISLAYFSEFGVKSNSQLVKKSVVSQTGKIEVFNRFNTGIRGIYSVYYSFKVFIASLILKKSYQISVLLWNFVMVINWYCVVSYLKRSDLDEIWSFNDVPYYLYVIQYAFLAVAATETYLWTLSKDELEGIFTPMFVIDFICLPPFLVLLKYMFFKQLSIVEIYWLYGFVGIIKILLKLTSNWNNEWTTTFTMISRFLSSLFLIALSYSSSLYIFQGVKTHVNSNSSHLNTIEEISNFFYFSVVTFSTVGYGDVKPLTKYSKISTVIFICWVFIKVPIKIHQLLTIINKDTMHYGSLPTRFSKRSFILIIGDISSTQLNIFIYSMFSTNCDKKLVVLTSRRVEDFDKTIILAKKLHVVISIVRGDIGINCSPNELTMVHIKNASYIVLINDYDSSYNMDLCAIGRAISLVKCSFDPSNIILQLSNHISKTFSNLSLQSVSLYQLKGMLFLKSLLCPGVIPLIFTISSPYFFQSTATHFTGTFAELPPASQKEYLSGIKGRLFSLKIPSAKIGSTFSQIVTEIISTTDLIILGIQNRTNRYFILNPLDYKIQEDDLIIAAAKYDDIFSLDGINVKDSKIELAPKKTLINIALNTAVNQTGVEESPSEHEISVEIPMDTISASSDREAALISYYSRASNKLTVSDIDEALGRFYNPNLPLVILFGNICDLNILSLFLQSGRFNVVSIFKQGLEFDCQSLIEYSKILCLIDADVLLDSFWESINLDNSSHFIIVPEKGENNYEIDMASIIIHRKLLRIISKREGTWVENYPNSRNWVIITEIRDSLHSLLLSDSKWKVFDSSILPTPQLYSSDYARGSLFFNDILYNLVTHNFEINSKAVFPQVFIHLIRSATETNKWDGIQLISISEISKDSEYLPCPTFNILYNYLYKNKGLVPIAIYRRGKSIFDRYVLPVPSFKTPIRLLDQIFVIPNDTIVYI